jgi:hypothetical protein
MVTGLHGTTNTTALSSRERVGATQAQLTTEPALLYSPNLRSTHTGGIMADILVVASKVKKFVRDKSGFNTSAEILDVLSQRVENLCLAAIEKAKADGRKTLKGRDLE